MSHAELKRIFTETNHCRENLQNEKQRIKKLDCQFQTVSDRQELEILKEERIEAAACLTQLENELLALKQRRKELEEKFAGVLVSEHAIVRYFERVLGFDIDEIKHQIVNEKTAEQIRVLKSGLFPGKANGTGFRVRVRHGTVTTVIPPKVKPPKDHRNYEYWDKIDDERQAESRYSRGELP
jgi:predicted nuclease with TOPRIM domain